MLLHQTIFTLTQLRLHGLPAMYSRNAINPPIAHDVVVAFAIHTVPSLPNEVLIAFAEKFPSSQNVRKAVTWLRLHEQVHVIRHDDERVKNVALRVEVFQRVGDNSRHPWIAQETFAVSAIKPLLTRFDETTVKFSFRFPIPRLRMVL